MDGYADGYVFRKARKASGSGFQRSYTGTLKRKLEEKSFDMIGRTDSSTGYDNTRHNGAMRTEANLATRTNPEVRIRELCIIIVLAIRPECLVHSFPQFKEVAKKYIPIMQNCRGRARNYDCATTLGPLKSR